MTTVWDSSAITPLVWNESSSSRMLELAERSEKLQTSILSTVEVSSAIARKIREGVISSDEEPIVLHTISDVMDGFTLNPVESATVLSAQALLFSHSLRAYDSIQLATWVQIAQVSAISPAFVSLDLRLRETAILIGATVLPQ